MRSKTGLTLFRFSEQQLHRRPWVRQQRDGLSEGVSGSCCHESVESIHYPSGDFRCHNGRQGQCVRPPGAPGHPRPISLSSRHLLFCRITNCFVQTSSGAEMRPCDQPSASAATSHARVAIASLRPHSMGAAGGLQHRVCRWQAVEGTQVCALGTCRLLSLHAQQ